MKSEPYSILKCIGTVLIFGKCSFRRLFAIAVTTMLHAQSDAFRFSYRLAVSIDCSSLSTRRLTHFPFPFIFHQPRWVTLLNTQHPLHCVDTWWLGSLAGHPVRTFRHLTMASCVLDVGRWSPRPWAVHIFS